MGTADAKQPSEKRCCLPPPLLISLGTHVLLVEAREPLCENLVHLPRLASQRLQGPRRLVDGGDGGVHGLFPLVQQLHDLLADEHVQSTRPRLYHTRAHTITGHTTKRTHDNRQPHCGQQSHEIHTKRPVIPEGSR